MTYEAKCTSCGKTTRNPLDFKCPSCGKPLEAPRPLDFDAAKIRRRDYSMWRYSRCFPYVETDQIVTLGEGWTPTVKYSSNAYFKLESLNPTGSFKDRGSSALISAVTKAVKDSGGYITEDSSGNAGASIAAYAARAGLKAKIYVPENVAGPKLGQTRRYGAEVVRVKGTRGKVAMEAQKPAKNRFYVGHILHPLFRDGIRSLAYEIVERSAWKTPESVYLPVSAGTLLLGTVAGFKHMADSGVIDDLPRIVACQTRQVSPLYHRFKNLTYRAPDAVVSIADALVSTNPPLLDLMVKSLRDAEGDAVIVEEEEIREAFVELALKGFFVEPSSAVAYAAYKKQSKMKETSPSERAVVILTGAGLKTTVQPCARVFHVV